MKQRKRGLRSKKALLIISAAAAGVAVFSGPMQADTVWVGTTGDWQSLANWSVEVPLSTDNADINNGGTAQIGNETDVAANLTLATDADQAGSLQISGGGSLTISGDETVGSLGTGIVTQTGGSNSAYQVSVGNNVSFAGTYNLDGGTLASVYEYVSYNQGAFNQNGGSNSIVGPLTLGQIGIGGTYNLEAGTLSAATIQVDSGTFSQTGGALLCTTFEEGGGAVSMPSLTLGTAQNATQYLLSGGTLTSQTITVQAGGSFSMTGGALSCVNLNINGGTVIISSAVLDSGAPVFAPIPTPPGVAQPTINISSGGQLQPANEYLGQSGAVISYTQTSATAPPNAINLYIANTGTSVATYNLSGGTLSTTNVYVGKSGNGNFVQSGGINSTGTLLLADSAGSAGSYTESGGLTTSDYEYIGESGPGIVTQTGGTNACGILMGLGTTGSDTGTYNLSGTGSLNVGGSGCAMFNGTFNQSGGIFTCTSYLNIGLGGTATYNLSGNGSLVAGNETIGRFGTGTLAQSGGVNSSMNIYEFAGGTYTLSAGSATLASNVYINGSYSQTGGSLTDSGSVVVGAFDVGPYPLQEFEPTGTGTLAVDGGNMNIVGSLDIFTQVNLEGGTLSVGALNTAGSPAYSVNPSDFLGNGTTTGWTGGTLTITGTNGFGVGTGGELGSSLTLSTGRTLDVVGILSNSGTLTLSGGSATVGSIAGSGTTTIGSGSTLQIAPHGPASSQSALTITGTGVMNITDNMMVINYGTNNPSPVSTIGGYIKTGYNGGSWNGPGIVSSEVAAVNAAHGDSHLYAVGYADASDPAVAVDHFTPGTVVIEPAIVGDANLDGVVNFTDFQLLAASFNQPNTSWDQGDFNYAGKTNFADFQLLAANFNDSTSLDAAEFDAMNTVALSHGQTLVANPDGDGFSFVAVPEPGVVAMLGIAGLGMLRRRRRI